MARLSPRLQSLSPPTAVLAGRHCQRFQRRAAPSEKVYFSFPQDRPGPDPLHPLCWLPSTLLVPAEFMLVVWLGNGFAEFARARLRLCSQDMESLTAVSLSALVTQTILRLPAPSLLSRRSSLTNNRSLCRH